MCTIASIANAQTKLAEISEPGRWIVYESGLVMEIDSLENAIELLVKAGESNCSAWIVDVDKNTICSIWLTDKGVQFRQSMIKPSEIALDKPKKINNYGSNK